MKPGQKFLAIEAASRKFSTAIFEGEALLAYFEMNLKDKVVESLGASVSFLLKTLSMAPNELGFIAIDVGPGSFSSLRSSVAFVKVFAYSLGILAIPVSSFDILVNNVKKKPIANLICSLEVSKQSGFIKIFQAKKGELVSSEIFQIKKEELKLLGNYLKLENKELTLAGNFLEESDFKDEMFKNFKIEKLADVELNAKSLGQVLNKNTEGFSLVDPFSISPLYVREPNIQIEF